MFWYNVELLQHTKLVDDIYIVTNSEFIKSYSEKRGIKIIWRGPNCSSDDEPLFNIIKYGYKSLEKSYDYIIHIMANSINNDKESIDLSIKHIHNLNLKEVRSYDKKGIENGLMVLHSDVMLKNELSTYVGVSVSYAFCFPIVLIYLSFVTGVNSVVHVMGSVVCVALHNDPHTQAR